MKHKWTYEGNKSFRQIMIILLGETLSNEILVGRKFRHFLKNSLLSPDKVSLDKAVGYTFYVYRLIRNSSSSMRIPEYFASLSKGHW